jgi:hypothetical protein
VIWVEEERIKNIYFNELKTIVFVFVFLFLPFNSLNIYISSSSREFLSLQSFKKPRELNGQKEKEKKKMVEAYFG